jgi:hypothetical protein
LSTELTNIYIRIAELLGPVRNLLIVVFLAAVACLVIWILFSDSEKLITDIGFALFWSFYLLMIEISYGQGLSIGNWTYEGKEEMKSSAPWLQVYAGIVLFFSGLVLTMITLDILSAPVR